MAKGQKNSKGAAASGGCEVVRSNEACAMWARGAVEAYGMIKEQRADYDDAASMITDLIADLLHLAAAEGIEDPEYLLETARRNYVAETTEPDDLELNRRAEAEANPDASVEQSDLLKRSLEVVKKISEGARAATVLHEIASVAACQEGEERDALNKIQALCAPHVSAEGHA